MTYLLCRIFIGKNADPKNPSVREKYGSMAGIVGIVVNLMLSALKLFIGILSASMAVVADALNNLSDAGASILTLVGFRMSAKPADRDHPFGHARMEYIISMIVSFLILLVGAELLLSSAKTLLGLEAAAQTNITALTIILLSASIVGKLWLALFYTTISKRIGSLSVKAAASDSLSDCISTAAVLASAVVIRLTGFVLLDAIVGLGVALLILYAGIKILNETKNSLLGEAPVDETVRSIEEILERYPQVMGTHDMIVHNYGPSHYIASLHVEVNGGEDIYELHDVIDNIEKTIHTELGILCTIHMDPIASDDETVRELRSFVCLTVKEIDPSLSVHDFRTVIGATHTNLIFDVVLPFECKLSEGEVEKKIEALVLQKRPDHYCVITVERG